MRGSMAKRVHCYGISRVTAGEVRDRLAGKTERDKLSVPLQDAFIAMRRVMPAPDGSERVDEMLVDGDEFRFRMTGAHH